MEETISALLLGRVCPWCYSWWEQAWGCNSIFVCLFIILTLFLTCDQLVSVSEMDDVLSVWLQQLYNLCAAVLYVKWSFKCQGSIASVSDKPIPSPYMPSYGSCVVLKPVLPCLTSGWDSDRQCPLSGFPHQGGTHQGSLQFSQAGHHQLVCDWRWWQSDRCQPVQDRVAWAAGRPGQSWWEAWPQNSLFSTTHPHMKCLFHISTFLYRSYGTCYLMYLMLSY